MTNNRNRIRNCCELLNKRFTKVGMIFVSWEMGMRVYGKVHTISHSHSLLYVYVTVRNYFWFVCICTGPYVYMYYVLGCTYLHIKAYVFLYAYDQT